MVRQVKILFAACFRFLNLLPVTLDKFSVKLQSASNHLVISRSLFLSHILRFNFYFFPLSIDLRFISKSILPQEPSQQFVRCYFHCFFCYLHKIDCAPKLTCFLFAVIRKLIVNLVDFVWKKMLVTLGLYVQPFPFCRAFEMSQLSSVLFKNAIFINGIFYRGFRLCWNRIALKFHHNS